MEDFSTNKRLRDDSEVSPETKRLRTDLLFDFLDDDDTDAGGRDPAVQELASVMRSLEEEIALLPSPPPAAAADQAELEAYTDDLRQPDLGYLLEASDDELGLPPTEPSSDEAWEVKAEVVCGGEEEPAGFGQIWAFDDGIHYEGLDFGIRPEERAVAGGEEGVVLDGGLFDYADLLSGASDFSDAAWRSESLPAV